MKNDHLMKGRNPRDGSVRAHSNDCVVSHLLPSRPALDEFFGRRRMTQHCEEPSEFVGITLCRPPRYRTGGHDEHLDTVGLAVRFSDNASVLTADAPRDSPGK